MLCNRTEGPDWFCPNGEKKKMNIKNVKKITFNADEKEAFEKVYHTLNTLLETMINDGLHFLTTDENKYCYCWSDETIEDIATFCQDIVSIMDKNIEIKN